MVWQGNRSGKGVDKMEEKEKCTGDTVRKKEKEMSEACSGVKRKALSISLYFFKPCDLRLHKNNESDSRLLTGCKGLAPHNICSVFDDQTESTTSTSSCSVAFRGFDVHFVDRAKCTRQRPPKA